MCVLAVSILRLKGLWWQILQLSLLSPVSPVPPFSNSTVLDVRFEKGESGESGESWESSEIPKSFSIRVSLRMHMGETTDFCTCPLRNTFGSFS